MEHTHAPMHGVPGRAGPGRTPSRRADSLPAALLRLQARAGNAAVARMMLARTPTSDAADAGTNLNHLDNETFPGLVNDTDIAITYVQNQINAYKHGHHGNEPPYGHVLQAAASGLLTFTQNVTESSDGSWTEAGEMGRLAGKNLVPIPARSTTYDADIEYEKGHGAHAQRIGIEAKAINTANTGTVTQQIQAAAAQLGTRLATNRGKITAWIAHADNRWPGIHGFNGRTTNAQIRQDVKAQLDGMHIPHTDTIRIIMVRTPAGHPSPGGAVTVKATGTNGNWQVSVIQLH